MRPAIRKVIEMLLRPFARLGQGWRTRRTIHERLLADARRAEVFRSENDAEVARSGARVGSPGWLIRTEQSFSPVRDRARAVNSPLSPKKRLVNSGGDKMSLDRNGYAYDYAEILGPWIGYRPVLVELGAFRGSGLALWCELFPDGQVIGLDVELDHFHENLDALRARGAFAALAPEVVQFDAYDPDTTALERALGGRRIDIFIDDGPHKELPSRRTAECIRPLLAENFMYVIEDVTYAFGFLSEVFAGSRIERVGKGLVVVWGSSHRNPHGTTEWE